MNGAVFFDLDGTLVDTSEDILASLSYAAKSVGYDSVEFARELIGLPVRSIFAQTIQGVGEDKLHALVSVFRDHHDNSPMVHWKPYDGLDALLDFLNENWLQYYVVTNRPRSGVANLIRSGFAVIPDKRFYCLKELCSDSKASLLTSILEKYKVNSSCSLLFGDHPDDIHAGRTNLIESYFCSYGFGVSVSGSSFAQGFVSSLHEVLNKIRARVAYLKA